MNAQIRDEVLRPRYASEAPPVRTPAPLVVSPGSEAQRVIERAAAAVRSIYNSGIARVSSGGFEAYADACAETWSALHEVTSSVDFDDKTCDIANAVFKRAFGDGMFKPTTLRAQVEMQMAAVEAARAYRSLFAKQMSLGV